MALKILSAAGFDGSGGAGVTSDAKVFSKYKILGLSAITAITAQNPDKIYSISPVPDDFFSIELKAVFDYFSIDAIKTGLIYSGKQSAILSGFIKKYSVKTIVVDPVFVSSSKSPLTGPESYPEILMPLLKSATVITPNIKEAELISGVEIKSIEDMKIAAAAIREKLPRIKYIVIKGSHLAGVPGENDKISNIAMNPDGGFIVYESKRIELGGKEMHGTGCLFSACLTARLASGDALIDALLESERYTAGAIRGFRKIQDNEKARNVYMLGNI